MKCFGTCQFLRGLWMDIFGQSADLHMRTDANNLVTTASTTHLPEQKETIHMINQLRHEACSGSIADLAHVSSTEQMADVFTKDKAPVEHLKNAVEKGELPNCDKHVPFREMMKNKHKAFFVTWLVRNLRCDILRQANTFLGVPVKSDIARCLAGWPKYQ